MVEGLTRAVVIETLTFAYLMRKGQPLTKIADTLVVLRDKLEGAISAKSSCVVVARITVANGRLVKTTVVREDTK